MTAPAANRLYKTDVALKRSLSVTYPTSRSRPGDNYEVTAAMATALVARGWRYGHDLLHFCFPNAAHDENAWNVRLHLPMQFFNGAVARASRAFHPVLKDRP